MDVDEYAIAHTTDPSPAVAKLRHDTSGARVVLEALHGRDDPFDKEIGVVGGVAGNMRSHRLDAFDRLGCPDDRGHRRSRRFASA